MDETRNYDPIDAFVNRFKFKEWYGRGSFCCARAVEETLIPVGIKLFEASFHGGHYKIPGLGRAFLAITTSRTDSS